MKFILLACLLLFSCKGVTVNDVSTESVLTETDKTGTTLQKIKTDHLHSFFKIDGSIVKFQTLVGNKSSYYEVSGFQVTPHKTKFLTAADKLNEIDLKVSLRIKAKAHRVRENGKWSEWKDGTPFRAKLLHTQIIRKNGIFELTYNEKSSAIVRNH